VLGIQKGTAARGFDGHGPPDGCGKSAQRSETGEKSCLLDEIAACGGHGSPMVAGAGPPVGAMADSYIKILLRPATGVSWLKLKHLMRPVRMVESAGRPGVTDAEIHCDKSILLAAVAAMGRGSVLRCRQSVAMAGHDSFKPHPDRAQSRDRRVSGLCVPGVCVGVHERTANSVPEWM